MRKIGLSLLFVVFFAVLHAQTDYNVQISVEEVKAKAAFQLDSILLQHHLLNQPYQNYLNGNDVYFSNYTPLFYLALLLVAFLGIIRMLDIQLFGKMMQGMLQPMRYKQAMDQVKSTNSITQILLNVFACTVIGFFVFLVINQKQSLIDGNQQMGLKIVSCITLIGIIYIGKYLILQFLGWLLNIEKLIKEYIYHVFLYLKFCGIFLLPLVFLLAFAPTHWQPIINIISLIVITVSMFLRYLNSWSSVSNVTSFNRFHFFTYLCASEILPLLLLGKLILNNIR